MVGIIGRPAGEGQRQGGAWHDRAGFAAVLAINARTAAIPALSCQAPYVVGGPSHTGSATAGMIG